MKKLYILLSLIMAAATPTTMSALTINATGGHVSAKLKCYEGTASRPAYEADVTSKLNTGIDILSNLPSYVDTRRLHGYVEFRSENTHLITKSTVGGVTTDHFSPAESQYYDVRLSFPENQLDIDMSVNVVSIESLRTSSFTFNIDRAAPFYLLDRSFTDDNLLPTRGQKSLKIPFIPGKENKYYLLLAAHEFSEGQVYYVKKNGVRVPRLSGQFNFTVNDGDVIDVVTEFPDEMFDVRFVEAEGSEGVLLGAGLGAYGDEKLENFMSFTAKAGTTIFPYPNNTDFDNISYTVDESTYEGDYFRYSRIPVDRNPMTIVVRGTRKPRRQLTVTVDDPSNIIIKDGMYSTYPIIYPLQPGKNIVDVAYNSDIRIMGSPTGGITGLTLDGKAMDPKDTTIYISDGHDEATGLPTPCDYDIVIATAPRERNLQTIIISDNYDGPIKAYTIKYGAPYELPLEEFNNHKLLRLHPDDIGSTNDGNSPYIVLSSGDATHSQVPTVVLDNTELDCKALSNTETKYYSNSSTWEYEDNHRMRIFGNGCPDTHKITFTTDFEPSQVSIIRDHVRPYTLAANDGYFYDYPGTTLHFATPAGIPADVKVNDTAITSGEDGRYMFTVEGPTNVSVMRSATTAIDAIDADASDAAPVYYNLQGIRVDHPTSGTYIVVRPSGITKETIR
ncbi:MAG: hypothetical protein K1V84_10220 [Muribaculaceae bacterium]